MKRKQALRVHPAGEESFVFPTAGGTVRLSTTSDALTPYGGLVPWSAFVRRCGMMEALAESCPVKRSSGNASRVYDVLQSFALTALCDGRRFVHVNRLREDPAVRELLGMETVVGDTKDFADGSKQLRRSWPRRQPNSPISPSANPTSLLSTAEIRIKDNLTLSKDPSTKTCAATFLRWREKRRWNSVWVCLLKDNFDPVGP